MTQPTTIHIIGTPVACADGVTESWRHLAHWVAGQLAIRYGPAVSVIYHDLFDPDCPPLPAEA